MNPENTSAAAISTGLRPMRSASILKSSDPTKMPNRAALNTGAMEGPAMCQSLITAGAVNPIAWTSKPSIRRHSAHRMKTQSETCRPCYARSGRE